VVKNVSAIKSGIYFLPFMIPEIVAVMVSGGLVTATGYYNPLVILGTIMMSVGAGLCTLFKVDTSQAQWVGYQILVGFGVGIGFQQGAVAAQNVLPMADVPTGTALVLFFQIFGGAVFVAVAQNLLASSLVEKLVALEIPSLSPEGIVKVGVTRLRDMVAPEVLPQVLVEYNASIVQTFRLALVLACISLIGALGMEWKSVKKQGGGK
jgi:MFS family permease